jgi:hypothetical protein
MMAIFANAPNLIHKNSQLTESCPILRWDGPWRCGERHNSNCLTVLVDWVNGKEVLEDGVREILGMV